MTIGSLLFAVQGALLLGATSETDAREADRPVAPRSHPLQRCTATVEATGPVRLRDGSTITIDPSSAAQNGDRVFIAGTPTLIWPAGAGITDGPISDEIFFGIIRNSTGEVSVVPPPLAGVEAQHPRVASAGAGGWHVIFLTGNRDTYTVAFPQADLWYGLFDGRAWLQVAKIASARWASLFPGVSSDLVVTRQGLRFAYSFDPPPSAGLNTPRSQGVVLLHRNGAKWVSDTLFTWEGPRTVHLVTNVDGSVTAMMAQGYFENGRFPGPSLFIAHHDTAWSSARLALDIAPRYIKSPRHVPNIGTGETIISWHAATAGLEREDLEWGLLSASGGVRRKGHVGAVELQGDQPFMFGLSSGRVLWLVRAGNSRDRLRAIVGSSSGLDTLGVIKVPLDNSKLFGVSLPSDRVIFVSGRLGDLPSEPFGTSYLTTIAVRCRVPRR